MIKSVTIQEFDKDVLKVGSFITFCKTKKKYTDEFRTDFQIIDGQAINAIISHVGKDYISVLGIEVNNKITIKEILNNEKRILGILENVIETEPTIPDEPEATEPTDDTVVVTPPEGDVDADEDTPPEDNNDTTLDDTVVVTPSEDNAEQTTETP